jgi:hypothetical protein
MGRTLYRGVKYLASIVLLVSVGVGQANTQTPGASSAQSGIDEQEKAELVKKLDQLLQQNQNLEDQARQVEEQNRRLRDEIREIREKLAGQPVAGAQPSAPTSTEKPIPDAANKTPYVKPASVALTQPVPPDRGLADAASLSVSQEQKPEEKKKWGKYTPNLGYKLADTEHGDLSVSIYTYTRYLNQRLLDATYTNTFGTTTTIQRRQDFQIQKVQIKFLGWVLNPKLRYFIYTWTSNPTQGLGAQVVVAGNLGYTFNKHFTLAAGITSLPGVRTTEGNFPFWLGVDSRMIGDEFFRPSYTSGIWLKGNITKRLRYQLMIGNNLSTLGVSAARLDNKFDTVSSALVWTHGPGEFGQGYGDFEDHKKLSTRLAFHFTRSNENKESQPNSDNFENTQLRLSDGSIIFTPELFGPGITITDARYRMVDFDFGLKYRGFALEGEYYFRWLDNFKFIEPLTPAQLLRVPKLFDHGFQLNARAPRVKRW